jgi:hypothetical protein
MDESSASIGSSESMKRKIYDAQEPSPKVRKTARSLSPIAGRREQLRLERLKSSAGIIKITPTTIDAKRSERTSSYLRTSSCSSASGGGGGWGGSERNRSRRGRSDRGRMVRSEEASGTTTSESVSTSPSISTSPASSRGRKTHRRVNPDYEKRGAVSSDYDRYFASIEEGIERDPLSDGKEDDECEDDVCAGEEPSLSSSCSLISSDSETREVCDADTTATSLLIKLFSSKRYLSHDFVYEWIYKISESRRKAQEESATPWRTPFEGDFACCMCICMFSEFELKLGESCLTMFSDARKAIYERVADLGSASAEPSEVPDRKRDRPSRRTPVSEKSIYDVQRYADTIAESHIDIYECYSSMPDECKCFAVMLFETSEGKPVALNHKTSDRFRKFVTYAFVVEFTDVFASKFIKANTKVLGILDNPEYEAKLEEQAIRKVSLAINSFVTAFSSILDEGKAKFFRALVPKECTSVASATLHYEKTFGNRWN